MRRVNPMMLNNPSAVVGVAATHRTSDLLTQADDHRMSALAAGPSSVTYVTRLRWWCGTLLVQIGNWLKGMPEATTSIQRLPSA